MPDFASQSLMLSDMRGDVLHAVTLSEVLAGQRPKAAELEARAVPLVGEDRVEAGRLYDASDGGAPFAVPSYTLDTVDGRFTSSLRWRRPEDDPNGPLAFFTLRFHVTLPSDRPDVREIPHQYTATLTSRVAVSDGSGAAISTVLGAVQRIDMNTAEVRLSIVEKAQFDALWQAITDPKNPAEVTLSATIDSGRQTWHAAWRLPLLLADLPQLEPIEIFNRPLDVPPWVVEREHPIVGDPPEEEEIQPHWVGTRRNPEHLAERIVAEPIVAEQIVAEPIVAEQIVAEQIMAEPIVADAIAFEPIVADELKPVMVNLKAFEMPMQTFSFSRRDRAVPIEIDAPIETFNLRAQTIDMPAVGLDDEETVGFMRPGVALPRRPWRDEFVRAPRPWRPSRGFRPQPQPEPEPAPEPQLIRLSLPVTAVVSPVSFPVETNSYMFDVPGDLRPEKTRLLLRHEFDPGGDRPRLVYYEDTAFPGRFYYEPQGFRVPRDANAPYLPKIRVAFAGVAPVEDDGATTVEYRARLCYTLVPDLDDVVLSALRRELATRHAVASPELTALLPTTASLELELPDDTRDLKLTPVAHVVSGETFDDGLTDEIELSAPEFAAVVTLLQTDALRGTLQAELTGRTRTSIPVSISLRESAHIELHRTYRGPIPGGLVRVSVTNPLESPVQIANLYRSDVGGGAAAFPQSTAGLRVAAGGGAVDLDYRLVPDNADVADLVPAMNLLVEADLRALLPSLLVNTGYADQTFPLTVSADASFFGTTPPDSPGPLAGLLVRFESDVDVLLTAAAPKADVALRMPMLPWLLKDPDAQSYAFRVVNLHGSDGPLTQGAVGPRTEGTGGGILTVSPASD